MSEEVGPFIKRIGWETRVDIKKTSFWETALGKKRLLLGISGPGATAAHEMTCVLIRRWRPTHLVSAGFAGGLNGTLRRGDIVLGSEVVAPNASPMVIDVPAYQALTSSPEQVHVGRLLSVANVVRAPTEKRALARQYSAIAVDMETRTVAQVCRENKVCFSSVRVVSDAADDRLPQEVDRLLRQPTRIAQVLSASQAILRRPTCVQELWQLKKNSDLAAERLASFLAKALDIFQENLT